MIWKCMRGGKTLFIERGIDYILGCDHRGQKYHCKSCYLTKLPHFFCVLMCQINCLPRALRAACQRLWREQSEWRRQAIKERQKKVLIFLTPKISCDRFIPDLMLNQMDLCYSSKISLPAQGNAFGHTTLCDPSLWAPTYLITAWHFFLLKF